MDSIISILLAGLFSGATIAAVLETFRWYKDRKGKSVYLTLIPAMHKIYSTLQNLRQTLNAQRVSIFKAQNGGGIPQIRNRLHISCLYEVSRNPQLSAKSYWQNQLADQQFIEILSKLLNDEHSELTIQELPESIFKVASQAFFTEQSLFFKISIKHNRYIFLVVDLDSKEPLSAFEHNLIRKTVNELSNTFNTNKQI